MVEEVKLEKEVEEEAMVVVEGEEVMVEKEE